MDPDGIGTQKRRHGAGRPGGFIALLHRVAGELSQERLARRPHQDRQPECFPQPTDTRQQHQVVLEMLAESDAGIDRNLVPGHTGLERPVDRTAELVRHLRQHVIETGIVLHGIRGSTQVAQDDAGAVSRGDPPQLRIVAQSGDVVHPARTGFEGGIGDLGLARVD